MNKFKIWMYFGFILILSTISITANASTNLLVKPSGDVNARTKSELRQFSHSNLEPTGLYMKKGDKIKVTASNITKAKIFLGLMGKYSELNDGNSNNYKELDLKNGTNEFTMDFDFGKIYIENLSETDNINVSIEGGRSNPIYRLGETKEEEFKNDLKNNNDSPFFELVGEHIHALFRSSTNNIEAVLNRDSVKALVQDLDATTATESESNGLFYGDSTSLGSNHKSENRIYFYEGDTNTAASATNLHIVLGSTAAQNMLASKPTDDQWTMWHEEGHTFQNPYMLWGSDTSTLYNNKEVTTNINSLYLQHKKGIIGRLYTESVKRDEIKKYLSLSNEGKDFDTTSQGEFKPNTDTSIWTKLGMFNQLMLAYGFDIFSYINQEYRNMVDSGDVMPNTNEEKRQCFMKIVSHVTKRNLTDYYEKWGLHPNEEVKEFMKSYPKPLVPIEDNLLPGNDEPIEDNILAPIQIPSATVKKTKFVLGSQPNEYDINDLIDENSEKNIPSEESVSLKTQIITQNDLLENSNIKIKLTNAESQSNIINIPVEKSYGNAISMTAYQSEERAIYTLHKKTKTIETFTDEARTTPILSGEGTYVSFKLMDANGKVKKEASCNKGVAPQEFVHSLRNIPYNEGDIVEISVPDTGKLQSYKNGEIDLVRSKSTKKEYFRIVQDQFIHLSANELAPTAIAVSQEVKIGDKLPEATKFVKDIKAPFGGDKVSINLSKAPSINTVGDKVGTVTLTDNITGLTSTIDVNLSVVYDNSLALAAFNSEDIRAVLRLDASNNTIVGFSNPDRTTPINSSFDEYWRVKIIQDGEIVKEVSASGKDTPFEFAKSLNGISYKEGDVIFISTPQKFIKNYKNNILTPDDYDKDNYFKIKDNQFVHVDNVQPTIEIKNDHLLYEKNENLTEEELIQELGVSTEKINQVSSTFESELSNKIGDHTITVTSTNPITGINVSKDVIVTITSPSFVLNGKLNFIDSDSKMSINKGKEVLLALSSDNAISSKAQNVKLVHQFGSKFLNLGHTLSQKFSNNEWENQEIDPNQDLVLTLGGLNSSDTYNAKYEISASQAISLKKGDRWEINYSYIDQVGDIKKTYNKVINLYLDVDTTENTGSTSSETQVSSKGMITFTSDMAPSQPVDPVDPELPVDPTNPINPNGAELMITYASDINFGTQTKSGKLWHALPDTVNSDNESAQREVVPFVSVKDSRGSERQGWKLEVIRDDEFRDTKGNVLKGVSLNLSDLNFADRETSPVATQGEVEINNVASVIASANSMQGSGQTSLALGHLKEIDDSTGKANKTSGVTLDIVPGTEINSDTYTTSITYELVAGV